MLLPEIPAPHKDVISYLASSTSSIQEAIQPYRQYESTLREIFAQDRDNPVLNEPNVNLVPIYDGHEGELRIRARDMGSESPEEKERYLLPLPDEDRRPDGSLAVAPSIKDFKKNFNLFSESSLVDIDWNNIVVAGSAAVTALLPVPDKYSASRRVLREYYHEKLAPASDVDLFLYGLTEEEAKDKIRDIEKSIRDSILYETTVIRTKYAITIASQHPCRHVQIVLRLYKNLSEILTSFDVDSACVAYDGNQVYATPRAIGAFITQTNTTDVSRRSPSYENRLSKYSHRGFEVYCPTLDRSRIDPTIFERSFGRVLGLARLLVLEKLPSPSQREKYMAKRRSERGRPALANQKFRAGLFGNIKDEQPDEVADWVAENEVSNYHTFTVPYGPRFYAKKIEKLLFTKDLLLNAEWNKSKDRTVDLHRHPAFFGRVDDIFDDCCGNCPQPKNEEEEEVAQKEDEIYIKGNIKFIADNPGRQQIGSFNPLTDDDWTEMAYVGNTTRLCQAIADGDVDHIRDWCSQKDIDINRRDHTGRTPLHLATQCSTPEVVQCLLDNGARITPRIVDGKTALHIAAQRGNIEIVKALIMKSEQNEEEDARHRDGLDVVEEVKEEDEEEKKKADEEQHDEDEDEEYEESESDEITQGSFVRVKSENKEDAVYQDDQGPDFYDPNVIAWDSKASPLHLAVMAGHVEVIRALVDDFGSDAMLPIKLQDSYEDDKEAAILTLVLATQFSQTPENSAQEIIKRGASSAQADINEVTALHHVVNSGNRKVLDMLLEYDAAAAQKAINHVSVTGNQWQVTVQTPLLTAIYRHDSKMVKKLLENGATVTISSESFFSGYQRNISKWAQHQGREESMYEYQVTQPLLAAIEADQPHIAWMLIEHGADINSLTKDGLLALMSDISWPLRAPQPDMVMSVLELVRTKIEKLSEPREASKPIPEMGKLEDDAHYLDGLEPDSYKLFVARTELEHARTIWKELQGDRDREVIEAKRAEEQPQLDEHQRKMLEKWENLEKVMVEKGAQKFFELHPDVKLEPQNSNQHLLYHNRQGKKMEGPYATNYRFSGAALNQANQEAYIDLFEAAWRGDTDKVKAYTLSEWTQPSEADDASSKHPPLSITMQDGQGFCPFSIAVIRGHLALADVILDIAMVQYRPRDGQPEFRYTLGQPEAEDDESTTGSEHGGDEDVTICKHIVDKKYTIDDIAALQDTVGSSEHPLKMLGWGPELFRWTSSIPEAQSLAINTPNPHTSTAYGVVYDKYSQGHLCAILAMRAHEPRTTLFQYAIGKNDLALFKYLMDHEERLTRLEKDRDIDDPVHKNFTQEHLRLCLQFGHTEILGEAIRRTGIKLPAKSMAEKSGIEVQHKSRYYQGLTVYGRKRKDWADRSRGVLDYRDNSTDTPLLLEATEEGNIDSIEYCLSDAPLRRYEEYAASHSELSALEALRKEPGGVSKAIAKWLGGRNHLAVHLAVMRQPRIDGANKPLELLLSAMPHAVDDLNCERLTPLHVAFRLQRISAARLLLRAGANQTARDRNGENILHHLLTLRQNQPFNAFLRPRDEPHDPAKDVDFLKHVFEAFVALMDPTLPAELLVQRSTYAQGSRTPLQSFLCSALNQDGRPELLRAILNHSGGKDLELMDGAGDYPLHWAVRHGVHWAARVMIDFKPALLQRENAVGLTPLELCEAMRINDFVQNPPALPNSRGNGGFRRPTRYRRFGHQEERKVRSDLDKILIDARAALDEHPEHRRKLVSLFDANEVAKRLAAQQERKSSSAVPVAMAVVRDKYDWNQAGDENAQDEVSKGEGRALGFKSYDTMQLLEDQGCVFTQSLRDELAGVREMEGS